MTSNSLDRSILLEVQQLQRIFLFQTSSAEVLGRFLYPLRKLKKFITIKDTMYDNLFNWIFDIAKKRVETPIDQSFGIDANSYDGWTIK